MKLTFEEIIKATGAEVLGKEPNGKFSISTDTRTIKNGEIYLPLKGETFDGENFIEKALSQGAIASFCTKEHNEIDTTLLKVEDTLDAYLKLAQFYKNKISPKVVAITGSSGKTTTKEMAFAVASEKFRTHKTEKNFNNEIGFCKTLLSMPEDTQVLIVEMGMRGLGEIELLSSYANPDIAIIANIGTAHIGRLGSRENIAKAKCEIVSHLNKDGVLIAHKDDLIEKNVNVKNKIYFSLDDVKIIERKIGYTKFEYKNFEYEINIEGDYNVQNSLATIEMGFLTGMEPQEIAKGLKSYSPIEKRWEIQEIKGFKIINDSYNANPESMQAVAKTVFDNYPNSVLVLGNMGELGENERFYHQKIGEFIVENNKKNVKILTVGNLAKEITDVVNKNGGNSINFGNNNQVSKYILDNVSVGTTIVLKASRSMKLEEILEKIMEK